MLAPAVLSAELGSPTCEETVAWFATWPSNWVLTFSETVAFWPLAIVPRSQVTVPDDSWQVPWLGVAESKVTYSGQRVRDLDARRARGPCVLGREGVRD